MGPFSYLLSFSLTLPSDLSFCSCSTRSLTRLLILRSIHSFVLIALSFFFVYVFVFLCVCVCFSLSLSLFLPLSFSFSDLSSGRDGTMNYLWMAPRNKSNRSRSRDPAPWYISVTINLIELLTKGKVINFVAMSPRMLPIGMSLIRTGQTFLSNALRITGAGWRCKYPKRYLTIFRFYIVKGNVNSAISWRYLFHAADKFYRTCLFVFTASFHLYLFSRIYFFPTRVITKLTCKWNFSIFVWVLRNLR